MTRSEYLLALDVGSKRIGVAKADTDVKIATPASTLLVDGTELVGLGDLLREYEPSLVVVGYPRNQSGEVTAQTVEVENFAEKVRGLGVEVVFRDESLTSVMAEDRLGANKRKVERSDIDAEAATIILQDYLEEKYGY